MYTFLIDKYEKNVADCVVSEIRFGTSHQRKKSVCIIRKHVYIYIYIVRIYNDIQKR